MKLYNTITFGVSLFTLVNSLKVDDPIYHLEDLALQGCQNAVALSGTFCPRQRGAGRRAIPYACYCKNRQALGTFGSCYVSLGNNTNYVQTFLDSCMEQTNTTISLDEFYLIYDNATNYFIDPETDPSFNATRLTQHPVFISSETAQMYYRTLVARWTNFNYANYFGIICLCYWGLVFLIASVFNWTAYFFPALANLPLVRTYRQYLSLPLVHRSHATDGKLLKVFHFMIPCRLDTVIITAWVALVIASQLACYTVQIPNATYTTRSGLLGRLLADRSGVVSMYFFPLLILFAGRNNFLQFFTRWKYSRMITVHRWVARVTVILVFLHTVGLCVQGMQSGSFYRRNLRAYVQWGWVAMVAGFIMMVQGCLYLRRRSYETFYLLHLLMAVIFTMGGWIHVEFVDWGIWYYIAVLLWGLDRLIRILRLVAFGCPQALVELKAEETLRVTIPRPSYWKPEPGQHAFVHFMRPSCFWQSHPFTLVDSETLEDHIRFYVKIKGGVTHGLYKYLQSQENKKALIKVSVEGPYGSSIPLKRFDNALFIAGGNGIPGLFAETLDLIKFNNEKQSVQLIWVIRHWKSLDWFSEELQKLANTKVKPVIYVTNPRETSGLQGMSLSSSSESDTGSDSDEKEKGESAAHFKELTIVDSIEMIKKQLPHITFKEGRPNVQELVKETIDSVEGSLAVVSCAHPSMVDDARAAVAKNVSKTKNLVELFDQLQAW